jgi:hypothetical protein
MDMSKLTHGAKLVLGTTIAYLIVSFFNWFEISGIGVTSGWSGIGFLSGLLAIAIIVWEALRLANMKIEVGLTPAMVTAALAVLLLLFAFIRFISKPGSGVVEDAVDRTIWAWLGLILAIAIVVSAWANMKMAGESISEMGASMKSAASSATAAAKAATDKGDDGPAAAPAADAPAAAPAADAPAAAAPPAAAPAAAAPAAAPPAPEPPAAPAAETPAPAAPAAETVTDTAAADDETPPATPA